MPFKVLFKFYFTFLRILAIYSKAIFFKRSFMFIANRIVHAWPTPCMLGPMHAWPTPLSSSPNNGTFVITNKPALITS